MFLLKPNQSLLMAPIASTGTGLIGRQAGPIVFCGSPAAKEVRVQLKTFGIPNIRVLSMHRCAQGSEPCRYLFRRD